MMEALAQFEWALILFLVLGLAIWELIRLRRDKRKDPGHDARRRG